MTMLSAASKSFFGDTALEEEPEKGLRVQLGQSINWGRLVPQIALFQRYSDAVANGRIKAGEKIVLLCRLVLGDILAGYYAKLIAAGGKVYLRFQQQ
ncbi:MAG: hypothetical protein ACLR2G_10415 [Phascolarctobacterium faecium]